MAATTTPSPTATASASPTDQQVTTKLKELIDTVSKNRTDQVKGAIDELTMRKRGFIGTVERVIEKTVTLKTLKGSKEVLVIEPSTIMMKDSRKATLDDIAVGDSLVVLGYTTDQDFTAKRITISTTSLLPKTFDTVIGTAQMVSKTQLTLTPSTGSEAIVYQFAKDTKFEDSQNTVLKNTDLKKDTQYLVISVRGVEPRVATFIKSLAADSR